MVHQLEYVQSMDRFIFMEKWCVHMMGILKEHSKDDPIRECGLDLAFLETKPRNLRDAANEKLQVFPFKDVRDCWKRLYTDACIGVALVHLRTHLQVNRYEEMLEAWVENVVNALDMAIIMTGAPRREKMIEEMLQQIEAYVVAILPDTTERREVEIPDTFPPASTRVPYLEFPVPKSRMTPVPFRDHIKMESITPFVSTNNLADWPALHSSRPWSNPNSLLARTFDGRRFVPVELGMSYTSSDFSQNIMTFADFMAEYLLKPQPEKLGYLAQHDIFSQVPALKEDIRLPFFCSVKPPFPQPGNPLYAKYETGKVPALKSPLISAWLGPAGTISPLHTDPYHNILCQVHGKKYIRLYAPGETPKMYPRGVDSEGVDMSNTSRIPAEMVEMYLEIDMGTAEENEVEELIVGEVPNFAAEEEEEDGEHDEQEAFPLFRQAKYMETVLNEGECLYIPVGWWHYVRSLEVSISVSFWWN
ncbi:MAG: hypothetical protein MMC33_004854 [Icmadophila ericetorum]|nr:hypothetical protein [Icmadophila ericetorum]